MIAVRLYAVAIPLASHGARRKVVPAPFRKRCNKKRTSGIRASTTLCGACMLTGRDSYGRAEI